MTITEIAQYIAKVSTMRYMKRRILFVIGDGKRGQKKMGMKLINLLAIVVTLNCSAYADHGITASGEPVRQGICAMDKVNGMVVPFGTRVILPDGRVLVVKDRFGGNFDNHLDIWMPTEAECWQFGRQWLKCRIETP